MRSLPVSSTLDTFGIDVRELPVGTYLLKMNAEGTVMTKKFVKK